ncbi:concanavalin A-like lectin/glucanase domain-containing protein [Pelagophyceae sp. CCMP2097]|nr:concanavalin A-like lectin/glucanase domain-containing protein [Pelagophyceae sp. CCMP2097]
MDDAPDFAMADDDVMAVDADDGAPPVDDAPPDEGAPQPNDEAEPADAPAAPALAPKKRDRSRDKRSRERRARDNRAAAANNKAPDAMVDDAMVDDAMADETMADDAMADDGALPDDGIFPDEGVAKAPRIRDRSRDKPRRDRRAEAKKQRSRPNDRGNDRKKKPRGPVVTKADKEDALGVVFSGSVQDKAPQLTLSKDQYTLTGAQGYRAARATHGANAGAWYYEVTILAPAAAPQFVGSLLPSVLPPAHYRVGWATRQAYLQAPLGYDQFGFAFCDVQGARYHASARDDAYGSPFGAGDVVGCLVYLQGDDDEDVCLPEMDLFDGDAAASAPSEKGKSQKNHIRFYINGIDQGVAFDSVAPGAYYPAVSLFGRGSVTANFGPDWRFPPQLDGNALYTLEPPPAPPPPVAPPTGRTRKAPPPETPDAPDAVDDVCRIQAISSLHAAAAAFVV